MTHTAQAAKLAFFLLAALTTLALAWWILRPHPPAPHLDVGTRLPEARSLGTFNLVDHAGRPFDEQRLNGRWWLVFFGYTHCPDICAPTLALMNAVDRQLKAPGNAPPGYLFVTLDPAHDDSARLAHFLAAFNNPNFIGLSGKVYELHALAAKFGVAHSRQADARIEHSGSLFVIDPQGRWAALFTQPRDAARIAGDMATLINTAH